MMKLFHYSKPNHHLHHLLQLDIHFFQRMLTNTAAVSCVINAAKFKGKLLYCARHSIQFFVSHKKNMSVGSSSVA